MEFPILEFDSTREAFIEPSKHIKPRDMPEHCVICFFKEIIDKVVEQHDAKILTENRWEDGPHPIYEIEYQGQRLAFYHPGVGAPMAAGTLEEAIAFGCRKFIACGGAGVLDQAIAAGNLVVVNSAVRDEGSSYHYLPPSREVETEESVLNAIVNELKARNLHFHSGKTWTTDAPYRETPAKISKRRAEGCLTVEMECAAMLAVAKFRQVLFGQILYGGDDLSGHDWDNRDWQKKETVREKLFWLCADICLKT